MFLWGFFNAVYNTSRCDIRSTNALLRVKSYAPKKSARVLEGNVRRMIEPNASVAFTPQRQRRWRVEVWIYRWVLASLHRYLSR